MHHSRCKIAESVAKILQRSPLPTTLPRPCLSRRFSVQILDSSVLASGRLGTRQTASYPAKRTISLELQPGALGAVVRVRDKIA